MTYSEKLKDPRWQKKRLEILQRDGFACLECQNKERTLHVHHSYYVRGRMPWEYPDWSLQTLCDQCHEICQSLSEHEFQPFELLLNDLSKGECDKNSPDAIYQLSCEVDNLRCELRREVGDLVCRLIRQTAAAAESDRKGVA